LYKVVAHSGLVYAITTGRDGNLWDGEVVTAIH